MPVRTFDDIEAEIRKNIFHPVYLLQGEEAWFIDQLSDLLERTVINESEREFNQTIVYGRDTEPHELAAAARRYPMMSNYQLVSVREAQDIKSLFRKKKGDEGSDENNPNEKKDSLTEYVTNPLKSTVLILSVKGTQLDKRTSLYKTIEKNGVVFNSKSLYDDKLPDFISQYLRGKGFQAKPEAQRLIAESIGNDLSRITNECDKLMLNLKPGSSIGTAEVEKYIGISKEFNVFMYASAIGERKNQTALNIAAYFSKNPKSGPIQLILGTLYSHFTRIMLVHTLNDKNRASVASALGINPFFANDYIQHTRQYQPKQIRKVISILREFDLKSKGIKVTNASEGELIREMTLRILHT